MPVPGPEVEPFADVARDYGVYVLLGVIERDGDAVHITAVLFAPDGGVGWQISQGASGGGGRDGFGYFCRVMIFPYSIRRSDGLGAIFVWILRRLSRRG